jgi:hypothetical protein
MLTACRRFAVTGTGDARLDPTTGGIGMGGFLDKAREMADQHDDKVDQGLEKAGDFAGEKTGGKYDEQIDKGVDFAQERTGEGDQQQ